jgi:hypothetical protein
MHFYFKNMNYSPNDQINKIWHLKITTILSEMKINHSNLVRFFFQTF